MKEKLISFPPVLPENPKVLILGSMPGGISLEKRQYYGNPRNHFWGILFEIFQEKPVEHYEEKIHFIKRHHLALWDTIGACYREGSLDANIVGAEPNDIEGLLRKYPTIQLIACNGTKSYQTFMKTIEKKRLGNLDVIKMPSTSPIPGRYTKSFAGKVDAWKRILDYL
ncbi:DNA-deoxyinosine glycosylase [Virgibacillus indicus]|uniref:DNA-deoxyinosine glycosylase n=1 Tax=Virgibacillus indicus TaxID=2024554 RepID=A0A265N7Q5_9BACI|nr:DNA-deoxyinosine glycosylase [Virgibacillus indicus]OZU87831.1 DNA-deoxyinosine glycosylase [Virgibacillus indicus]